MCFDGGALARAQYARANFRISPELFIFFGARSFIADKGVVLVDMALHSQGLIFSTQSYKGRSVESTACYKRTWQSPVLLMP